MEGLVRGHLSKGNTFRLRVLGGSMFPLIRSGDIVRVNAAADYSAGDVLLCAREGGWVAHRVVGIGTQEGRTRLVMRGDALPAPDPSVPVESVLGRVDAIERRGRHLRMDGFRGGACRILARFRFPWHRVIPAARVLFGGRRA